MDFSRCQDSNRFYDGSERKKGILVDGHPYIIKFRKNSKDGLRFNHISEYVGSHLFQLAGILCHETYLGTYCGEEVVVIKDFLEQKETFVPFNGVGESSIEQNADVFQYSYEDIIEMLHANIKITSIVETEDLFWNMFVMDAWLGNFDRHGGNWGFIKKNNEYRSAPVFDNGSCLFPALNTDALLKNVLFNQDEIDMRVYKFPTSQIKLRGKKSSYYEVISSCEFEALNCAIIRLVPVIEQMNWRQVIEEIDMISDVRKEFYVTILEARLHKILVDAYRRVCNRN